MSPATDHALSALVLLCCAIGLRDLALASFALALWHAARLVWSMRPARAAAWRCEVRGRGWGLVVSYARMG
jgi:hypothetical protein